MLYGKVHVEAVFVLLSQHRDVSVKRLHVLLHTEHAITMSLQQLYKTINALLAQQVIVKQGGKIRLNDWRIGKLQKFVEQVNQTYRGGEVVACLPGEGNMDSYVSDSLYRLDPLWNDVLHQMVLAGGSQELFFHNSHPYHILGLPGTERSLMAYLNDGYEVWYSFGNETVLDVYGASLLAQQGCHVVCDGQAPFMEEGYCNVVIGPYILECVFPATVNRYFGVFFDGVKDIADFDAVTFAQTCQMKCRFCLTVKHAPAQAEVLKGRMKGLFAEH